MDSIKYCTSCGESIFGSQDGTCHDCMENVSESIDRCMACNETYMAALYFYCPNRRCITSSMDYYWRVWNFLVRYDDLEQTEPNFYCWDIANSNAMEVLEELKRNFIKID